MAVIDASVLVTVLADGEHAAWAEEQLSVGGAPRSLWAPHLIDAEIGNSFRRMVAAGEMEDQSAVAALHDLSDLPLRRIVHVGLLERSWQLRHNLSFYDALYVALAELLEVPLLTVDGRLAKAAATTSNIEVLTAA